MRYLPRERSSLIRLCLFVVCAAFALMSDSVPPVHLLTPYAGIFAVAFAVSYHYFYRLYPSLAKVNS